MTWFKVIPLYNETTSRKHHWASHCTIFTGHHSLVVRAHEAHPSGLSRQAMVIQSDGFYCSVVFLFQLIRHSYNFDCFTDGDAQCISICSDIIMGLESELLLVIWSLCGTDNKLSPVSPCVWILPLEKVRCFERSINYLRPLRISFNALLLQ